MRLTKLAGIAGASAAMFSGAHAATFFFGGVGGNLGKTETFTSGSETVTAIAINTEEPNSPSLDQELLGIGVSTGLLDTGQLDNIGDDEAIVFDFGAAAQLASITLSHVGLFDEIAIYGSNNAGVTAIMSGGLGALTSISTFLASATGGGLDGLRTIDLTGIATAYRFLIATVPGGSGDGYRVKHLTAEVSDVPIPAALPLLMSGLAGLSFASRRRKQQA